MKISIIIVTYKSNDIIGECLSSISDYSQLQDQEYEVIIVDNSPDSYVDELKRIIADSELANIKFINSEENIGYGAGNNVGLRIAKGNVACIMNPDIRLIEPLFAYTVSCFNSNKELALIGYKQKGGVNLSFYVRPERHFSLLSTLFTRVFNKFDLYFDNLFYLSGALMFVSLEKFREIDLFDENYFLYLEEPDISNRFLKRKYIIKFISNLSYCHNIDYSDRRDFNQFAFDAWFDSVKYYHKKFNHSFNIYILKKRIEYISYMVFLRIFRANNLEKYRKQFTRFNELVRDEK
jgi:GT2 family glycosyltransferase